MSQDPDDEVPEYLWRLTMYFHDLLHIKWGYEGVGVMPPRYILDEVERVHDRLEWVVTSEHSQGGAFHKLKMEIENETRSRGQVRGGRAEG